MNDYGMTIIAGGREIEIPVLPQKLKVTSPGNNDKATVLVLDRKSTRLNSSHAT